MQGEYDNDYDNIPVSGGASYRVSRKHPVMDSNTKRLAVVAGGIGAALLALVAAWSLTGHRQSGVPVVEADTRPVRVRPDKPGGLEVVGQNETILSGDSTGQTAMAPAPEVPAPQALKAQEPAPPPPVAQTTAPPTVTATPAPPPAPVQTPPVAVAPPAPVPPAPVVPSHVAQVPAKVAPPVSAGSAQVQLAAVPSEQAALAEWKRLEKRMPDMLSGRHPTVMKFEHDGKTYFRLRTGGFADIAQASGFCEKVRGKGGNCAVATF